MMKEIELITNCNYIYEKSVKEGLSPEDVYYSVLDFLDKQFLSREISHETFTNFADFYKKKSGYNEDLTDEDEMSFDDFLKKQIDICKDFCCQVDEFSIKRGNVEVRMSELKALKPRQDATWKEEDMAKRKVEQKLHDVKRVILDFD